MDDSRRERERLGGGGVSGDGVEGGHVKAQGRAIVRPSASRQSSRPQAIHPTHTLKINATNPRELCPYTQMEDGRRGIGPPGSRHLMSPRRTIIIVTINVITDLPISLDLGPDVLPVGPTSRLARL